jgi:hypothetical protein
LFEVGSQGRLAAQDDTNEKPRLAALLTRTPDASGGKYGGKFQFFLSETIVLKPLFQSVCHAVARAMTLEAIIIAGTTLRQSQPLHTPLG